MKCNSGQNIVEYALPLALIVVITGAWLTVPGLFVSHSFNGSLQGKTLMIQPLGTISSSNITEGMVNSYQETTGRPMQLTMRDGQTLSLRLREPEIVAEAQGGNGITENALATLDQLIAELTALNPDDPKIPMLSQLSSHGHEIKDLQAAIEARFPPGGFEDADERTAFFQNKTIQYHGQEIPIVSVIGKLNWFFNDHPDYNTRVNEFAYEANESFFKNYRPDPKNDPTAPINRFMDQLSVIRNSQLFQDPAMKTMVDDILARQIFLSSGQTLFAPTKRDVQTLVNRTHLNSDNLCSLSRYVSCSPNSAETAQKSK